MTEIILSEFEQRLAKHLAEFRQRFAESRGYRDNLTGDAGFTARPRDVLVDLHLQGIGAELAFARLMNVFPYAVHNPAIAESDASMFGRSIDVKASKKDGFAVWVAASKATHPSDAYAFFVGAFPKYRFAGLIDAEKVFVPEQRKDGPVGPGYAVPKELLHQSHTDWLADAGL